MKSRAKDPQLWLNKGDTFHQGDREYVVVAIADATQLLVKEVGSQATVLLNVAGIAPPRALKTTGITGETSVSIDLTDVPEEAWEEAERRREWIDPLLDPYVKSSEVIDDIIRQSGASRATLFRWLRTYRNTGLLSSLLPAKRNGGRGRGRLPQEVEAIIHDRIQNFYLTDQQPSIAETAKEIRRLCSNCGLAMPHLLTVRKRIEWISKRERMTRRKGARAASLFFDPNKGSIPDADWPLAMVQMDHTLLPIMIVDDINRKGIGRPWITLAIDVYSRMAVGMYLSLDSPSAMSAGLCICHAIMGKEHWLEERKVDMEWPCWGVMGCIHMDNAREFRGDMLRLACNEYDIDLQLRPVKKPEYGAHVERLMGTVSERLKRLPGATFSGVKEKGVYDSEDKATMSFSELEQWIALMIDAYHKDLHAGIGTSPRQKWIEGLLGGNGRPPRGLPARRFDEEKIQLDFMPFVERTVQDYGVLIDDVCYFHDVLRPWINARDPKHPKSSRLFRFKRDPRDISQIYFFDPDIKRYYSIPYRDSSLPPVSIWELREAKQLLKGKGKAAINEREIFAVINRQRKLEEESAAKTKAARKAVQKRTEQEKSRKKKATQLPSVAKPAPTLGLLLEDYDPSTIRSFDEDEE